MKRHWVTCVAVVVACTFLLSGMALAGSPIKARISLCNSETHPQSIGMQLFKKYVEEKTKGGVQVALHYNSSLGGERESVEQVKGGSLEMATASAGPLTTFNNKFMVLDIPFAFDSYEIAWGVLDGPMGQKLLDSSEGIGLKGLAYLENGYRHVTNNVRPINGPDDLKGIKIRTMEAPMHMENFKQLGANPTPVPWTELYLTMQQKVVDGQENPLANIWEVKMFEVQKYASLTGHIYDPMPLVANLAWFNKLPKDYQVAIEKGALLAQNYSRFVNKDRENQIAAKLTAKGMKVNEVSAEGKEKMRAKSQAAVVAKIKATTDKKFVDDWLAAIATMKKDVNAGF
ncbi:MAG TPA: TRAP transporter substrate-binding protein [Candidatus Methylomirabilis sp.]|nr:TRAP transporter substrate-binding protein [Candidatus Methylomirabilis sp.]